MIATALVALAFASAPDLMSGDLTVRSTWGLDRRSAGTPTLQAAATTQSDNEELSGYAAEVTALFEYNFHPPKRVVARRPAISAQYHVDFDPLTGRVLGWAQYESSGARAYDAAVERAIDSVETVPLPPEKFKDVVGSRFTITFRPPREAMGTR